MTLVIAHRGASRAEPENTLAAFERAREMGADGVELDVRRTADDRLVVHHDPHLPDGRVIRETLRRELPDAIPELAAALDACDGMFVNVEIKNDPDEPDFDPSEWLAGRVVDELVRRTVTSRWLVSSFRYETIMRCAALQPTLRLAWLTWGLDDAAIERASAAGLVAVHPWVVPLEESAIRRAHGAGLAVTPWTCDDPERMRELMSWGIDGICTNVPDVAIALRRGR